jgi:hypothetical protein
VDLWEKYSSGIAGKMSILEANQRLGSSWRQHPTEARFYLRRKKYYDAVTTISTRDKIALEAATEKLKAQRPGQFNLRMLSARIKLTLFRSN